MPIRSSRRSTFGFIPIPASVYTPAIKVTITDSSSTVHTLADTSVATNPTNQISSFSYTPTSTEKIGNFTVNLNNNGGKYLNTFGEGDIVQIYMDFSTATTLKFRGKIDNDRYSLDGRKGFICHLEGREYPELVDDVTTLQFDTTDVIYCLKGQTGTADAQGNYPDGALYGTGLTWSDDNTILVGDITDTITQNYQNRSYWDIIRDLCKTSGLDCYLIYDTTDTRWEFRVFTKESIENTTETISQGINLSGVSRYGIDNTTRVNKIIAYGKENGNAILLRTVDDDTDIASSWAKTEVLTDSDQSTMDELANYANKELANRLDIEAGTRLTTYGIFDINSGERIQVSVPYCGMNGLFVIRDYAVSLSDNGSISTTITVQQSEKNVSDLFQEAFNIEKAIKAYKNLNKMDNSFNISFADAESTWYTLVNSEVAEEKLRLTSGSTVGTMTTTTGITYSGAEENITKCELRLQASQINNCTFDVSNDNAITWETVTFGEVHTFSSTGKILRLRINLAESASGISPEIDEICILYK